MVVCWLEEIITMHCNYRVSPGNLYRRTLENYYDLLKTAEVLFDVGTRTIINTGTEKRVRVRSRVISLAPSAAPLARK